MCEYGICKIFDNATKLWYDFTSVVTLCYDYESNHYCNFYIKSTRAIMKKVFVIFLIIYNCLIIVFSLAKFPIALLILFFMWSPTAGRNHAVEWYIIGILATIFLSVASIVLGILLKKFEKFKLLSVSLLGVLLAHIILFVIEIIVTVITVMEFSVGIMTSIILLNSFCLLLLSVLIFFLVILMIRARGKGQAVESTLRTKINKSCLRVTSRMNRHRDEFEG